MYKILVDGQLFTSSKIEQTAVLNPVIDIEVNKAGTFKFTVPPIHPKYDLIQRRKSLVQVYRDDESEPLFEGICVDVVDDFFKQRSITCEGELTFFNDSTLRPHHYIGQTTRQLLEAYVNEHNSHTEAMKHFAVGQVTVVDENDYITCFTNYNNTMQELKEDLVDDYGGYFRVRHPNGVRTLDYLAESPRVCEQAIKIGFNLLDLSRTISASDIATAIIPLGATIEGEQIQDLDVRVGISTCAADEMHPANADYVYSSDAVTNFGWIERVVTWDDITDPNNLIAKAKAYLQSVQWENLVIEAKAIDLGLTSANYQKFKLLDRIRVISAPHGLDRYFMLTKMTINLNNPENDTITLGESKQLSLSAKTVSDNEAMKRDIEKKPTSNQVKSAIDNATALITGAEGGYVVIERNSDGKPIEIKIQDSLTQPTRIWRWNQNGFGYSSDGGTTYGLAMTMDGAIVADYITSGTMYANRIKGGTLLLGGADNVNGEIEIRNANGDVIGRWNKDGITIVGGTMSAPTINGGIIQASTMNTTTMSGGSINIGDNFSVNSNGDCVARVLTVGGTISSLAGAVTISGNFVTTSSVSAAGHGDFGSYVSASEFIQTSDKRLKEKIKDINLKDTIGLLKGLIPKNFVLKSNKKKQRAGFIAQEVQQILDDTGLDSTLFVNSLGEDEDSHLALNYSDLIAYLVKGWQYHEEEIETLKERLKEVENGKD